MEPPSCPSPPPEPQNLRNWPQNLPPRERTQLRNRRYAALAELIKEGDYFSEERMRLRAPGLFHHYIGRFRDPKTPQNHPKTPQNHPKNHPKNPQNFPKNPKNPEIHPKMSQNDPKVAEIGPKVAGNGAKMAPGLRELLLTALEAGEAEDDDDDEEEEDEDEDEEQLPDEAEQELLRLEFTSLMHQRFLEGLDRDFDYSLVDAGGAAGALDLLSQDLEDRYFDEEEPGPAPPLI
ncbi:coiled-coil domain-containing protein 97 [Passerculus sandwichensis]